MKILKNCYLFILTSILCGCGPKDSSSNFNNNISSSSIENSYKKQMSNVNLGYIIDNLLFNILKEKFLCKQ